MNGLSTNPMKDVHLFNTMNSLKELCQWLDFVMRFTIEYPADQPVRYEWFVNEYPNGKPGNPDVKAQVAGKILAWRDVDAPLGWTTAVAFAGGKIRELDIARYRSLMSGEIGMLQSIIAKRTAAAGVAKLKLPSWFPRENVFPGGDSLIAMHADYLDMREKVLDYYTTSALRRNTLDSRLSLVSMTL